MFQVAFNASFTLKTGRRTKTHIAVVKRFHNQLAAKVEPPGNLFFQLTFPLPQYPSLCRKTCRGLAGSTLGKNPYYNSMRYANLTVNVILCTQLH